MNWKLVIEKEDKKVYRLLGINGEIGYLFEDKEKKLFRSKKYNYNFSKTTGYFERWGRRKEDDPPLSPFGPELLDIEISTICHGPSRIDEDGKEVSLGPCSCCLPPGTKIRTTNGDENIEDIKIENKCFGIDERTSLIVEQEVSHIFEREVDEQIIKLELEDGTTLSLTKEHPVFVRNKGWIEAKDLIENDDIIKF